jgi:hypothetical protein
MHGLMANGVGLYPLYPSDCSDAEEDLVSDDPEWLPGSDKPPLRLPRLRLLGAGLAGEWKGTSLSSVDAGTVGRLPATYHNTNHTSMWW